MDVVLFEHVDELGKGRRDPDAGLVLDTLVALAQHLLDAEREIFSLLLAFGLAQIHEHGDEGRLPVGGHEGDDLVLDGLDASGDLVAQALLDDLVDDAIFGAGANGLELDVDLTAYLLAADVDKGREVRERDGLAAVLAGGHLGDDLRRDVAGRREAVGLLDHGARDHGAVLEHVLKVHEVAVMHVLCVVVGIVEVDDSLVVSCDDLAGEQFAHREVLGDLTGHVVTLHGDDAGVLVGVLLFDLLVVGLDEREDLVIGGVLMALQVLDVAVDDVLAGYAKVVEGHELILDEVLDLLDGYGVAGGSALVLDVT